MNRTVPYLAGATNEQLNFEAGENVLLRLDPTARLSNFVISSADRDQAAAFAQRRVPRGARAPGPGALDREGQDGRQPHGDARIQRQCPQGRKPVRPPGEERS